jgi:hypothetical protein
MKSLSISALSIVALAASGAFAQELPKTTERVVNISSALIPSGFDNSEPVAIVHGLYPNSCYSWNRADVTHPSATLHEVRAVANVSRGMCLMVMVPYAEEVPLGRFSAGQHTIRFVNGDGTYQEKALEVR